MWKSAKKLRKSLRWKKSKPPVTLETPKDLAVNLENGPKVVMFDFGSVLRVKTAERKQVILKLGGILKEKLNEYGIEVEIPTEEKPFKKLMKPKDWKKTVGKGKISREQGWFNGFTELGIKPDTEENKQWIRDFVQELDFGGKEIMDETRQLLQELKEIEGVHLAVLSNHSLELYSWLEDIYKLIPTIFPKNLVMVSAKVGKRKPSEEIYQAALDMLAEHIEAFDEVKHRGNVLFIDNKKENCDAADGMGIQGFHYLHDAENRLDSFQQFKTQILNHLKR